MTLPSRTGRRPVTPIVAVALLLQVAAATAAPTTEHGQRGLPEALTTHVLNMYPHDRQAFTQGLLLYNGKLYESTGRYGVSELREVERSTGRMLRSVPLAKSYFGEGLARVGQHLIQLTWEEHVAFEYNLATFRPIGQFTYTTQGWDLCFDGTRLVMSDGSDTLYLRDPSTFAVAGKVRVTFNGQPQPALNELECVGGAVYANIWLTDTIIRIDPRNGSVTATINASGLLNPAERASADVRDRVRREPGNVPDHRQTVAEAL